MNKEKVIFAFFIVLALTLNFGFFLGEIDNPEHHNVFEFFAAIVVSLICTALKFWRSHPPGRVNDGNVVSGGSATGYCRH